MLSLYCLISAWLSIAQAVKCEGWRRAVEGKNHIEVNGDYLLFGEETMMELVIFEDGERVDLTGKEIDWYNPREKVNIFFKESGVAYATPIEWDGYDLDMTLISAVVTLESEPLNVTTYVMIYRPWGKERPLVRREDDADLLPSVSLPVRLEPQVMKLSTSEEDAWWNDIGQSGCGEDVFAPGPGGATIWEHEEWEFFDLPPPHGWPEGSVGVWDCFLPMKAYVDSTSPTELKIDLSIFPDLPMIGVNFTYSREDCFNRNLVYVSGIDTDNWCCCVPRFWSVAMKYIMMNVHRYAVAPDWFWTLWSYWPMEEGPRSILWKFAWYGRLPGDGCQVAPCMPTNMVTRTPHAAFLEDLPEKQARVDPRC